MASYRYKQKKEGDALVSYYVRVTDQMVEWFREIGKPDSAGKDAHWKALSNMIYDCIITDRRQTAEEFLTDPYSNEISEDIYNYIVQDLYS